MNDLTKILTYISQLTIDEVYAIKATIKADGTVKIDSMSKKVEHVKKELVDYLKKINRLAYQTKENEIFEAKLKNGDKGPLTPKEKKVLKAFVPGNDDQAPFIQEDLNKLPAAFYQREMAAKLDIVLEVFSQLNLPVAPILASSLSHITGICCPKGMIPKVQWENLEKWKDDLKKFPQKEDKFSEDMAIISELIEKCEAQYFYLKKVIDDAKKHINKKAGGDMFAVSPDPLENIDHENLFAVKLRKDPSLNEMKVKHDDAVDKLAVIQGFRQILHPKVANVPPSNIIKNFRQSFEDKANQRILNKRRDSKTDTFLKVVASILTLGIAAPFLFFPKSREFVEKVKEFLPGNKPKV